ncbi:glycosyltransferase family A protein [Rhodoferax sp. GW822-FHT02A01]|uniref:glycosyltransferase family A protein n=1 Tax=Rhodoferax sp. GW822-FHT02A01 TaxID=3141537 RepID=UPI00315C54E0
MKKLSIISHFYNHPDMVLRQIRYWETLPESFLSQVEFILVDDCSEERPEFFATNIDLKVFRITTDIPWNQAGARNLGIFNASGEWALYFDIDQHFYAEPMHMVLNQLHILNKNTLYYFKIKELVDTTNNTTLTSHPSTFLVDVATFKRQGMYDEDFAGHYGYEDLYMPRVWERNGGVRTLFSTPDFFEDTNFGTSSLSRDLSRNAALGLEKIRNGTRNSVGILRFEWEQVPVPCLA